MKCCEKCFEDEFLKQLIINNNEKGCCDYCLKKDVYVINIKELSPYFLELEKIYTNTEAYVHYDPDVELAAEVGTVLICWINEEWSIFSKEIQYTEIDNKLLFDILNANNEGKYFSPDTIYSKLSDGTPDMDPMFEVKLYWNYLKEELKHENRFFPYFSINHQLLDILKKRIYVLHKGNIVYRARLGNQDAENMLAPPPEKATAGRANPKGISYLYCADCKETAVAEIRPWKGFKVTIASIQVNKDLKLVDLSNKKFSPFMLENYEEILLLDTLINNFAKELSRPIDPSNSEIDYLPTQYLTELIKMKGYDGIYFKSAMGPKYNIVIFDSKNVNVLDTETVGIIDIEYRTLPNLKKEDNDDLVEDLLDRLIKNQRE
ncbi:RES domain-containing protein [Aeribacillus pallidus]|uniref:RES domain-containing protein n=1 Tax=Aeribacillus pallidus TaxID=33936 RepID=UPI0010236D31|nr:RES domain-containing protein [Aeribacillus pallidus]RZI52304.1 RES domain-containing protein [Aeribacillus pallidus]